MSNRGQDKSMVDGPRNVSSPSKKRKRRKNKKGVVDSDADEMNMSIAKKKDKQDSFQGKTTDNGNNGTRQLGGNGSDNDSREQGVETGIKANLNGRKPDHAMSFNTRDKKPKISTFIDKDESGHEEETYHNSLNVSKSQMAQKSKELMEMRSSLPIFHHKEEILKYYAQSQVIVVIGETGSGKSTQIPQFLMPVNKKQIAVTQPRRVAAASLAQRVSEEYGCRIGDEVGYHVRFSNVTNHKTKLKYLTDGMLLREIMLDGSLNKYTTIIIDEAHERTILTDMILGFLKQLLVSKRRTDLKVIVMSATLNAELFSDFFNAPILYVEGRTYPVTKFYLQDSSEDIVDTMVRSVVQVNLGEGQGDILCFLPGQEEIDNAVNVLQSLSPDLPREAPLLVPLPLYAALTPVQQSKIFEPVGKNRRKVILATNIAETSITVSGVRYVIDSGLRKVKVWKHQLGLSTLLTTTISQASAKQRAGRAGREATGKVFRLYSEKVFNDTLPKEQESEITRNDIVLPVLTLKKIGVDDLLNWPWLEHPGEESILSALSTLYSLGALDDNGVITKLGYKMAVLPLQPQLSTVLITAFGTGVLRHVIDIVACLSVDNLILNVTSSDGEQRDEVNYKRRTFCPLGCQFGDLIALKEYLQHFEELGVVEAKDWCKDLHFNYKAFKNVLRVRQQLKDYMMGTIKQDDSLGANERSKQLASIKFQLGTEDDDLIKQPLDIAAILKSFLKGYITNTAIGMPDRSYRTCTNGQLISIHPSSNLFGKSVDCVMYIEYVFTAKGYGRTCSNVELSWLQEVAPHILGKVTINEE